MGNQYKKARLVLEDKTVIDGFSFGFLKSVGGEVVFNTGMVGYIEALTDPSYAGQILVLTYPLIGNYGVPQETYFESARIQVAGLVVSEYCEKYSHAQAKLSLAHWLKEYEVPAICGIDTRELTKKLRSKGVMLGNIVVDEEIREFYDPNRENLVAKVSCTNTQYYGGGGKTVIIVDCGVKQNSIRSLVRRGIKVKRVPWDYDFSKETCNGIFISNGPGDPMMCSKTIANIKKAMANDIPIFGICLGAQLMALALGANTYKLKYGHRSQNQPVIEVGKNHCFITSQNHGYAIDKKTLPEDWEISFTNINDDTVEGIAHKTKPWSAVQFHPEACPGPTDTEWLFDEFVRLL